MFDEDSSPQLEENRAQEINLNSSSLSWKNELLRAKIQAKEDSGQGTDGEYSVSYSKHLKFHHVGCDEQSKLKD